MISSAALDTRNSRTAILGAVTAGALAVAALGSVPTANATCASFFGIGSGGQCTSTLTSIAIAIGTNAEAHADGILGAALTLGDSSSASTATGALLNIAATLGNSNQTIAGGLASLAFVSNSINQTVIAGAGSAIDGSLVNLAISLAGPEATQVLAAGIANFSLNVAGTGSISGNGVGLTTVNVIGLSNGLVNTGVLNGIVNLSGNNNSIGNGGGTFNLAFNTIGSDNVIITDGTLAVAGAIGSTGQDVSQTGPGLNVAFGRQAPAAAARAAAAAKAPKIAAGRHRGAAAH